MTLGDFDAPLSDDERIWVLLDRYVAGEAQSLDLSIVREWVVADPSRAQIVEDLRRIREVALASRRHRSAGEGWRDLLARVNTDNTEVRVGSTVRALRRDAARVERRAPDLVRAAERRPRLSPAFAAAVLLAVSLPLILSSGLSSRSTSTAAQRVRDASRTFATARGRRAEIRLPDGTRVSLAPESRVTWRTSSDTVSRDVLLQGEAYFDFVHDPRRPFRVRALNAVIRDLGTRFAVRAYPSDSVVRVAVTYGQVRVRAAKAPSESGSILDPGMLAMVNAAGMTSLRKDSDTARYNAFARGQMQFDRTPLRAVIGELERWYDIDIRLGDSVLGSRRITATLQDQTLPDLLAQLSLTLNMRVTRTGRLVVLRAD